MVVNTTMTGTRSESFASSILTESLCSPICSPTSQFPVHPLPLSFYSLPPCSRSHAHRKNPSQLMLHKTPLKCCVRAYTTYINIESLRMRLYVVQESYILFENYTTHEMLYTTYDQNLHNIWKILDNIYKILEQHMTSFTQHMTTIYTACKRNYTTYKTFLNNLWHILHNIWL